MAALGTAAIKSYADFEQLKGGVETLFGSGGLSIEEYAQSMGKTVAEVSNEYQKLMNAQDTVLKNAGDAFKTAGLSANEYMETVTGFSASLLQSVGGDTERAAKAADQAIIDMSDNANKMGTSMESIQNAYQGFAKQNYTMLDNLKLGYGGTKEEMQRLLDDASKISGIKYDISSFADVTEAIHVMQEAMGIAGTTAKEASSTISGSIGMMKSSWSNLLVGIADDSADFDQLINNFVDSVATVGENILPRVEIALKGIGQLITKLLPVILAEIPTVINDILPDLLSSGVEMINTILKGIQSNLPVLITGALDIIMSLANGILSMLPTIMEIGMQLMINLMLGIASALPQLIASITETVVSMTQVFIDNLPLLIDAGFQLIMGLVEGVMESLPTIIDQLLILVESMIVTLIDSVPLLMECGVKLLTALVESLPEIITKIGKALPKIVSSMVTKLLEALPLLINCGVQLLTSLVNALPEIISSIVEVMPEIIDGIVGALLSALPQIVECGIQLLLALINALPQIIGELAAAMPLIVSGIVDALLSNIPLLVECGIELFLALVEALPEIIVGVCKAVPEIISAIVSAFNELQGKMAEVGKCIIDGIWEGISGGWDWLVGKVKEVASSLFTAAKKELDIHSPSRKFKWLGEMCVAGFEDPMEDFNPYSSLEKSIKANVGSIKTTFASAYAGGNYGSTVNMDYKTMKRVFTESLNEMNMVVQLNNREVGRAVRGYS